MFLTSTNLVHFLISRRLVEVSKIVDGNFSVIELGRRNRNFRVDIGPNSALFVKQTKSSDSSSLAHFKREMDCYVLAQSFREWSQLMPGVLDIDQERHSMSLEFVNDSESLTQYHWRICRFSNLIAEKAGSALASFHRAVSLKDLPSEFLQRCQRKPVWILQFNSVPNSASGGAKQMLSYMQQDGFFGDGLQALERDWKFDHLIHGDMKWDNCLVHPGENQIPQLKIIDWELVDIGDAKWDLAGLMHSFFVFWVESDQRSVDHAPAQSIAELIARENTSQGAMRQSLFVFWRAYQNGLGRTENDLHELESVMRFVAARLVLTCYEGVCSAKEMSKSMSMILQLARLLFEDPSKLVKHWFTYATGSRDEEPEK